MLSALMNYASFFRFIVKCALFSILVAPQSFASTLELELLVLEQINFDDFNPPPEKRKAMAQAIKDYWTHFDQRIPRLTPKEADWLDTEINSGDNNRFIKAIDSKEHSLRSLLEHSQMCLRETEGLLSSFEDKNLAAFEMLYWVRLLNCYRADTFLTRALKEVELWDEELGDKKFSVFLNGAVLGTIIEVVIPAAMAETMDWTLKKQ